jgi:hypothetical protein
LAPLDPRAPPVYAQGEETMDAVSPTIINLIIFVLAIYVGYHVVWTVTPALHTPLMKHNAIATSRAGRPLSEFPPESANTYRGISL